MKAFSRKRPQAGQGGPGSHIQQCTRVISFDCQLHWLANHPGDYGNVSWLCLVSRGDIVPGTVSGPSFQAPSLNS